jgi:hypothetical protein
VKAVQGLSKALRGEDSGSESGSESDSLGSADDLNSAEGMSDDDRGSEKEAEVDTDADKEKWRTDPAIIRRLRAQLRTAEDILLVPILPKVTNIGLQISVTCTFYMFGTYINQQMYAGRNFYIHFEPIF